MLFPLRERPRLAYDTGGRRYGAKRSGGTRKHAVCDLITPTGTAVRAVEEGAVLAFYFLYHDTYALQGDHGDFTVRYGEVSRTLPAGICVGAHVIRGQTIGYGARLSGGEHMLHFEMYAGTATGPVTNRSNPPFRRRRDRMDPTRHRDAARLDSGEGAAVRPEYMTSWSFARACFSQ